MLTAVLHIRALLFRFVAQIFDCLQKASLTQTVPDLIRDINALLRGGDVEMLVQLGRKVDLDLDVAIVILERSQRVTGDHVNDAAIPCEDEAVVVLHDREPSVGILASSHLHLINRSKVGRHVRHPHSQLALQLLGLGILHVNDDRLQRLSTLFVQIVEAIARGDEEGIDRLHTLAIDDDVKVAAQLVIRHPEMIHQEGMQAARRRPVNAVKLFHHHKGAMRPLATQMFLDVLCHEGGQGSLPRLGHDDQTGFIGVLSVADLIDIDGHRPKFVTLCLGVNRVTVALADGRSRQTISIPTKPSAVALAVSAAPGDRGPDHFRFHPVPVVENRDFRRLLVRSGTVVTEDHMHLIGTGLIGVVDLFIERRSSVLVADIPDAANERITDGQAEVELLAFEFFDVLLLLLKGGSSHGCSPAGKD